MGGSAFASGPNPLRTPRMPRAVYMYVKNRCHTILKQYYTHVATPIEAPVKKDYGDVDFLVACPTQICHCSGIAETLAKALGAKQSNSNKGCSTVNFALPWPKELRLDGAPASYSPPDEGGPDIFVQVDVHVCDDKEGWEWELFLYAHGDLWSIIGSIVSKYGLTINNLGLVLRIEEIEHVDRKRSMLLLTKRPSDVLSFLGLDESPFWHEFQSVNAMYEYAATCRYFSTYKDNAVKGRDEDKIPEVEHVHKRMRIKMKARPLFRKWVEEFIPRCRASGAHGRRAPSREQIRDDVFEQLGMKNEYEEKLDTWLRERKKNEMWRNAIKASVPTKDGVSNLVAAAVIGLKAVLIEGDLSYGVILPSPLKTADAFYDMNALVEILTREWQHVGAIELEKQRVRAAKRMEVKRTT